MNRSRLVPSIAAFSIALGALALSPRSALAATFGKPLRGLKAASLADVLAKPQAGQVVRLEGVIDAVCQNKGCWLAFKQDDKNVHVTFEGYSFFVPRDVRGKKVVLEGKVLVKERKKDEIDHLEGEGAKAAGAKVSIEATGVEILDAK
jgi:hypothetical protein